MDSKLYSSGDPENDAQQQSALEASVHRFRRAATRWPEGLLFGEDLATLPQVMSMKSELQSARRMDRQSAYQDFLDGFETKLTILIGQLRSDEGKCFF